MKGYRFRYSYLFEPVFQWVVNHTLLQAFENLTSIWRTAQLVGFVADRECRFRLGFLCSDTQAIALVGSDGEVFPLKIENIANA